MLRKLRVLAYDGIARASFVQTVVEVLERLWEFFIHYLAGDGAEFGLVEVEEDQLAKTEGKEPWFLFKFGPVVRE